MSNVYMILLSLIVIASTGGILFSLFRRLESIEDAAVEPEPTRYQGKYKAVSSKDSHV